MPSPSRRPRPRSGWCQSTGRRAMPRDRVGEDCQRRQESEARTGKASRLVRAPPARRYRGLRSPGRPRRGRGLASVFGFRRVGTCTAPTDHRTGRLLPGGSGFGLDFFPPAGSSDGSGFGGRFGLRSRTSSCRSGRSPGSGLPGFAPDPRAAHRVRPRLCATGFGATARAACRSVAPHQNAERAASACADVDVDVAANRAFRTSAIPQVGRSGPNCGRGICGLPDTGRRRTGR